MAASFTPINAEGIMSTEFPRLKTITEFCVQCGASFPPRPGEGICKDWERCLEHQINPDVGTCMALHTLSGKETEEWNGDTCGCEHIQGNWNCKLNPY